MKNGVFWDIKTQFVPHMRQITSPLQSTASYCYVLYEVLMAVTMKIQSCSVPHRVAFVITDVSE
jgi:hypothetical protein